MIGRAVLYTKRVEEMAAFYTAHFGFTRIERAGDRIVELCHPQGGAALLLHAAAKGQKEGQVLVKLVMDVADVPTARQALIAADVQVGPVLDGGRLCFCQPQGPLRQRSPDQQPLSTRKVTGALMLESRATAAR